MFYPIKKMVVVNTKTDRAFRGILWRKSWGLLVLRNAEMIKAGGDIVKVDGELIIMAVNVDFIQVV